MKLYFNYTNALNTDVIELKAPLNRIFAWFCENLRSHLWSREEIQMYKTDNITSPEALLFRDLNIHPVAIHDVGSEILKRYRKALRR